MKNTSIDQQPTPVDKEQPKRTIVQHIAYAIAASIGWKVEADLPIPPKCIVVGAPHTASTDLLAIFLLSATMQLGLCWVGKDTLFRWPLGVLLRRLGGIPVNRRERTNFVDRMVRIFDERDKLRLAIGPEGTRRKISHWKTGFYYIALNAGVPIVLGFADYDRKVVGLGQTLVPTGDIQTDFEIIRAFYTNVKGKYPHKQSEVRINVSEPSRVEN
jgi:1-acyl-sn-glycerol-3-phosphate acyltransferase